jgi:hypothetical protein
MAVVAVITLPDIRASKFGFIPFARAARHMAKSREEPCSFLSRKRLGLSCPAREWRLAIAGEHPHFPKSLVMSLQPPDECEKPGVYPPTRILPPECDLINREGRQRGGIDPAANHSYVHMELNEKLKPRALAWMFPGSLQETLAGFVIDLES